MKLGYIGAWEMVLRAYYIGLIQQFLREQIAGNALGMGFGAIQSINDMAVSHPPCLHVWFIL